MSTALTNKPSEPTTNKSAQSTPEPLDSGTLEWTEIDAIVGGYHGAPHTVLGMHVWKANAAQNQIVVRAFRPLDKEVYVYDVAGDARYPMRKLHKAGFYELLLPERSAPFAYRLILVDHQDHKHEIEDSYRFPFYLTDFDLHLYG